MKHSIGYVLFFLVGLVIGFSIFSFSSIGERYELLVSPETENFGRVIYKYNKWNGNMYIYDSKDGGWVEFPSRTLPKLKEINK